MSSPKRVRLKIDTGATDKQQLVSLPSMKINVYRGILYFDHRLFEFVIVFLSIGVLLRGTVTAVDSIHASLLTIMISHSMNYLIHSTLLIRYYKLSP